MIPITPLLFIFAGILANTFGSIPEEVHITFGDELSGQSLPQKIKLWACKKGYQKVPDDVKVAIHECRQNYSSVNEIIACDHICMWKGLGYVDKEGKVVETRLLEIGNQMYNDTESAKATATEFAECYKEHPGHFEDADVMDNRCEKGKDFHECYTKKAGESCK